ncbi:MAG TPA: hypothetical protein DDY22_20445 [Geobacter sp.]|nr:hypothetical protein [Geobacter sp.]
MTACSRMPQQFQALSRRLYKTAGPRVSASHKRALTCQRLLQARALFLTIFYRLEPLMGKSAYSESLDGLVPAGQILPVYLPNACLYIICY